MQWISVKDTMPTKDGQYLTYSKTKTYDSIQFTQYLDGEFMASSVTHWIEVIKPLIVPNNFSVHIQSSFAEKGFSYEHWSNGLKMIIVKNGVTICLNSEEIEQLVKTLPKTLGGTY